MINTIFYFTDHLPFDEYISEVNSGNIAPHTIVFVDDIKAIYKGGLWFGSTNDPSNTEKITNLIEENKYDDTTIIDWLNRLLDLINATKQDMLDSINRLEDTIEEAQEDVEELRDRLDGIVDNLNTDIERRVTQLFKDAHWIQKTFPEGTPFTDPNNNFGQLDVQEYLQRLGIWYTSDDATYTLWSGMKQRVDSIELSVSSLIEHDEDDNPTLSEALQSWITSYINGKISGVETGTYYAAVDDIEGILKWLYSGMKAETSEDLTYSQLVSAAKNNELGTSAIAGLTSRVKTLEDGNYVAESELSTKVDEAIGTILTRASQNSALVEALASINNDIAGLRATVENLPESEGGGTVSTVTLLNSVKDEITDNTLESGILSAIDTRAQTVTLDIVSAIKDNATGEVTASSVINSIIADGTAKTALGNYIASKVTTNDQGLNVDLIVESYVATYFLAALNNVEFATWASEVNGSMSAISALDGRVETIEGDYVTSTNIASTVSDLTTGLTSWAGLATLTSLNSAKTVLQAGINGKVDNDSASIILAINDDGESSTAIKADKIEITGTAIFNAINNDTGNTKINAGKLDTSNITIPASRVTDLETTIQSTTIDGAKIKTGSITANKIAANAITGDKIAAGAITANKIATGAITADKVDATSVVTNAMSTIDAEINGILTGRQASFEGTVIALDFLAGDPNALNITTTGTIISFNYGSESRAYFASEGSGMLLHIKDPDTGDWHCIDFSKWSNTTNPGVYPAHNMTIYKLGTNTGSGIVIETKTIYYEGTPATNTYGRCYLDGEGTIPATAENVGTGWYYSGVLVAKDRLIEVISEPGKYEPNVMYSWAPISINSSNHRLTVDVSPESAIFTTSWRSNPDARYIVPSGSNTVSVAANNIYTDLSYNYTMANNSHQATYDDPNNVYPLTYSNNIPSPGLRYESRLDDGDTFVGGAFTYHYSVISRAMY